MLEDITTNTIRVFKQFIPKNEGTITLTIDNHENIEINPVFKNVFFKTK